MLVGYARISTAEQNFELQMDALEAAGCEKFFTDTAGGAKKDRKILQEALEYLREGDTLVVWRLDRLGRSLKQLIELMNEFQERGICFKSLVESIDTTSPMGKFFFHITGAFAELERNLIRERTNAGLKAARSRGRKGGRPRAIKPKTFDMALQLYNENKTPVGEICEQFGIVRRTFYRYLSEHNEKESKKK